MNRSEDRPSSAVVRDVRLAPWFMLLLVMIAVAYYNFSLLSGPMAELVGGGSKLFGIVGTGDTAAAVIVILEISLGLFFLEGRGVTKTIPVLQALDHVVRTKIQFICIFQLFMFAAIGAGLILMHHLLENQGVVPATEHTMVDTPLAVRMAIAFALPFVLMLAPMSADRVTLALRDQRL